MYYSNPIPPAVSALPPAVRAFPRVIEEGLAVVDALLAETSPHDRDLMDAVLDLRSICAAGSDAEACVRQLFHVRNKLAGRHYYPFFRVRSWARRSLRVELQARSRGSWHSCDFPLNSGRLDEAINTAIAAVFPCHANTDLVRVRFVFVNSTSRPTAGERASENRWRGRA